MNNIADSEEREMQIKHTEALIDSARAAMAGEISTESHASFPIPMAGNSVAFMFCPAVLQAGVGLFLFPPSRVVYIDAVTGSKITAEVVTPPDFGRADPPNQILGQYNMLRSVKSGEEFLAVQQTLFRNYEYILPFFFGKDESPPVGIRQAALEFLRDFEKVVEAPLLPYYEALGRDFFAWLRRVRSPDTVEPLAGQDLRK